MSSPPVLTDPRLAALPGVRHAFFTRHGGVSQGLYASLNLGLGSRDDPEAVAQNRTLAAEVFGRTATHLLVPYQVHSALAVAMDGPWGAARQEADGVVTATSGLICGALAADCAPILLADAQARVVGACHAGWRGALGGIVPATVERMAALGARPERIVACVGPCIGPDSYEVGLDFLATFRADGPEVERFFRQGAAPDKRLFDLPAFVLHRLAEAGVSDAAWIGRDTCTEADDFFSNRRAVHRGEGDYGRLLSAIMLD